MKEAFEKIIERLEERQEKLDTDMWSRQCDNWYGERQNGVSDGIDIAIEIVNQVAEEYKTECNSNRLEPFDKIAAILQKYRKKWLEQPNTEPCKGLECISDDCVDCMLTHLENDINQVAEEYGKNTNFPSNAFDAVYSKVLKLEQQYAKIEGNMETVNRCIRLENLLQYFKEELRGEDMTKYNIGDKFILEITSIDQETIMEGYPKPAYRIKGMEGPFSENVLDGLERIEAKKETENKYD